MGQAAKESVHSECFLIGHLSVHLGGLERRMLGIQRVQNLKEHLTHNAPDRAPVCGELLGEHCSLNVAIERSRWPENSIIRSLISFAIRASLIMSSLI
jgi:hypothetical protein